LFDWRDVSKLPSNCHTDKEPYENPHDNPHQEPDEEPHKESNKEAYCHTNGEL
jgi:hypothetical protein